jgi:hypothetical protein
MLLNPRIAARGKTAATVRQRRPGFIAFLLGIVVQGGLIRDNQR